MKDIEAMKQALEALELAKRSYGVMLLSDPPQDAWKTRGVNGEIDKSITSLRQAISEAEGRNIAEAEKQEPVPRVVLREGSPTLLSDKAILPTDQRLYTHPDPDALHTAYMSGFYDGKKAERRERSDRWVGLTDEEMEAVRKQAVDLFVQVVKKTGKGKNDPIKFGRLVEAKLKEKNT